MSQYLFEITTTYHMINATWENLESIMKHEDSDHRCLFQKCHELAPSPWPGGARGWSEQTSPWAGTKWPKWSEQTWTKWTGGKAWNWGPQCGETGASWPKHDQAWQWGGAKQHKTLLATVRPPSLVVRKVLFVDALHKQPNWLWFQVVRPLFQSRRGWKGRTRTRRRRGEGGTESNFQPGEISAKRGAGEADYGYGHLQVARLSS